jgi:hypothetical protein
MQTYERFFGFGAKEEGKIIPKEYLGDSSKMVSQLAYLTGFEADLTNGLFEDGSGWFWIVNKKLLIQNNLFKNYVFLAVEKVEIVY